MNKIKGLILGAAMLLAAPGYVSAKVEVLKLPMQHENDSIYGIISIPEPEKDIEGRHGVAIVSHGFNGTHHFAETYFSMFNDLGYAVYAFDYPCGSVHSLSDSNTLNMSIKDEVDVLKMIVSYFQHSEEIDAQRIVLVGESQGGLVSAMAGADLRDGIESMVLIYPALCIPDNWNTRYPSLEDIPDKTDLWGVPLGRRFFMELRDMRPYEVIGGYEGPVLIMHGSDDRVVPVSYSEKALGVYKNARMHVLEKEGHGFSEEGRRLSNEYIRKFLGNKSGN